MTVSAPPSAAAIGLAVLSGSIAAACAALALGKLAEPEDAKLRLAALNKAMATTSREIAGLGREVTPYRSQFCAPISPAAVAQLRNDLAARAARVSVTLESLSLFPGPGSAQASPIDLQLRAAGPYESVVRYLDDLATGTPKVFATNIDLVPRADSTQLNLVGRMFCRLPA